MAVVAGVDGCRHGWLMVRLDTARRALAVDLFARWRDVPVHETALTAVDMPIGLTQRGPRACDLAARALLPRARKSSVFPAPRRYMLDCATWRQAQDLGRRREATGLSKQSWNLIAKIAAIDTAITPAGQASVREAHPELIFHHLNGWRPVPRKKTPEGLELRRALLTRAGIELAGAPRLPRQATGPDDVLDAAACALVAERILAGRACRVPDAPPRDRRGLAMEIWY